MWICLCKGVSDRRIREVVRAGARTMEAIGGETAAGTDCGKCLPAIRSLLEHVLEEMEEESGTKRGGPFGPVPASE